MLTAVVCGILCGNRGDAALVEWLHDQTVDVWHGMGFTRRPPKVDGFRDLLMRLDPADLEGAVRRWTTQHLGLSCDEETLLAVSIDGKTLCGTLRAFASAVHLLAAVDPQTGCVLRQCRASDTTNEHKAALERLRSMALKGSVVVGDAIFRQPDLCEEIVAQGATTSSR